MDIIFLQLLYYYLRRSQRLDEGRLLDFCTLITALPLHDRLITLPARIPSEIEDSRLYKYLKNERILYELDFDYSNFDEQEKFEIEDIMGDTFSEKEANWVLGNLKQSAYTENYPLSRYKEYSDSYRHMEHQRSDFIDEVITKANDWKRGIPPNSVLNNNDEDLWLYRLRTVEYWEISGMTNGAFLPDLLRIPIIAGYGRGIRESIRMLLQMSVDYLSRQKLESLLPLAAPIIIPTPNAVSNFLNSYSSTNSLEESFNYLRKEFAEHKKAIVRWEARAA